jgi:hypothetical protein
MRLVAATEFYLIRLEGSLSLESSERGENVNYYHSWNHRNHIMKLYKMSTLLGRRIKEGSRYNERRERKRTHVPFPP